MKAQLYDDADYVRIFNGRDPYALMDCHLKRNMELRKAADIAIKRCGLSRKSKWKRWSGFYESQISFKR